MSIKNTFSFVLLFAALGMIVGCNSSTAPQPAESAESQSESEIEAQLAKLSPEDRAKATTQLTCPISKEPLGSMGVPVKVSQDGKEFFICCAGCEDQAKADFAAHYNSIAAPSGSE